MALLIRLLGAPLDVCIGERLLLHNWATAHTLQVQIMLCHRLEALQDAEFCKN